MYDLFSYYVKKIQGLMDEIAVLKKRIVELETYVFELIDKDCPEEYKHVVKTEVFKEEEV